MRSVVVPILLAALLASSTAQAQRTSQAIATILPDFTSFAIMQPDRNGLVTVSIDQTAAVLKDYDAVFVGEQHGHVANHLAQMALLRALHRQAPQLALSMEQFERDQQPKVDDYLSGRIGEETLIDGIGWKNYAQSYRPLVEYAKEHRLPVIAANAPQNIVRCVGREGSAYLQTIPADRRKHVAAELHLENGAYKQKFLNLMSSGAAHDDVPDTSKKSKDDQLEKSFAAQVTRDDTMAESIANFLGRNPGFKVLHVTGAFHVEDRLGTIERLSARVPNLKIALVLPLRVNPPDFDGGTAPSAQGADYVILMRREPEPYAMEAERKAAEARQGARYRSARSVGCRP
ncbi:hypothetical protein AYO42_04620 [Rhizomicrobium sp. SCGC AG-212-E05]|nr:hypothetical protein AYO42_04620 [Rhizomicrobium sp. SCGC AG-212-E05]